MPHLKHAVPLVLQVLQQKLGECVECTVAKLMRYGVFLNLAFEVAPGCMCEVYGLMHHSKMGDLAVEPLQVIPFLQTKFTLQKSNVTTLLLDLVLCHNAYRKRLNAVVLLF